MFHEEAYPDPGPNDATDARPSDVQITEEAARAALIRHLKAVEALARELDQVVGAVIRGGEHEPGGRRAMDRADEFHVVFHALDLLRDVAPCPSAAYGNLANARWHLTEALQRLSVKTRPADATHRSGFAADPVKEERR